MMIATDYIVYCNQKNGKQKSHYQYEKYRQKERITPRQGTKHFYRILKQNLDQFFKYKQIKQKI